MIGTLGMLRRRRLALVARSASQRGQLAGTVSTLASRVSALRRLAGWALRGLAVVSFLRRVL